MNWEMCKEPERRVKTCMPEITDKTTSQGFEGSVAPKILQTDERLSYRVPTEPEVKVNVIDWSSAVEKNRIVQKRNQENCQKYV